MNPRHLLALLALLSTACAPPNSRAVSLAEEDYFARLDGTIDAYAAAGTDDLPRRVVDSLRAARREGRIRLFHEEQGESGVVRGTMVAGTVYVHESHAASEPIEESEPAALLASLSVYFHEGVHLTQSWLEILLDTDGVEEEAYQRTHAFQAWYLGRLLRGPGVPDLGLAQVPPERLLAAYRDVHAAFARSEVSDRCAERLLDRLGLEGVEGFPGRSVCVYRGRLRLLELEFASAGLGRASATLEFDLERPEEEVGLLSIPGRSRAEGRIHWRGLTDDLLLPGFSDAGRREEVALGFYLALPPSGENQAEAWNLARVAERLPEVGEDRVRFRLEVEGEPGRWRLAFAPLYVLSFEPAALAAYRPARGEGREALDSIARLQRRAAALRPAGGDVFLYYDRQPRRTRILPIGTALGPMPAALALVEWEGPDRFRPPVAPSRGWALPGWRPYGRHEAGFDRDRGQALAAEVLWDSASLRRPGRPPFAFVPIDRRRALVVVDPADFATPEPAYRIAIAHGE